MGNEKECICSRWCFVISSIVLVACTIGLFVGFKFLYANLVSDSVIPICVLIACSTILCVISVFAFKESHNAYIRYKKLDMLKKACFSDNKESDKSDFVFTANDKDAFRTFCNALIEI